ncbi:hypothetical protein EIN_500750 [Entamoeba invadens IP1]|uniref:Uncharacterized protein n=1 Tax=Entamoeba invadens IP1 TaxID=370355 RepID=L7FK34_ENTIV|nr:hypothetical protein EIN_500750 [Entamoeba invadens IP1]ELP83967.1 hypothetical protein EIN_500750 [Entamoeba invadens IP1]|eukprot:XP_004183313.1 hypothetical protein EIN_500750 [Entamoeba invadens IP1]
MGFCFLYFVSLVFGSCDVSYDSSSNCAYATDLLLCSGEAIIDAVHSIVCENGFKDTQLDNVTFLSDEKIVINSGAFMNTPLKEITVKNVITYIGHSAFQNCTKLSAFPKSYGIEFIGNMSFAYCTSLTHIEFSNNLMKVGGYTFMASGMKTFSFRHFSFKDGIFKDCKELETVNMYEVIEISAFTFQGCTKLKYLINSKYITIILSYAFDGCVNLHDFVFSRTTLVDVFAFRNSGIRAVITRASYSQFYNNAFEGCKELQIVENRVAIYISANAFSGCTSLTHVNFPLVKSISSNAFQGCTSLREVDFPSLSNSVSQNAFENSGLTHFTFVKNVVVESNAFKNCRHLESVDLGSIYNIGESVFEGCTSLKTVKGIENVTQFRKNCFKSTALEDVSLLKTTTLREYAFDNCTSLKHFKLKNVKTLPTGVFRGCTSLEEIEGLSAVTQIQEESLAGTNITFLKLSKSVTYGVGAFSNSKSLTFVDVGDVTVIPDSMFKGCTSLRSVDGFERITEFGENSFEDTGLTQIVLNNAMYHSGVFRNNKQLTSVDLNGTTSIMSYMFSGCNKLSVIEGIEELISIDEGGLQNTAIPSFICGEHFTTLGKYALSGSSIESASLNSATALTNGYEFNGCSQLKKVDLCGHTDIKTHSFDGCEVLDTIIGLESVITFGEYSLSGTALTNYTMMTSSVYPEGVFKDCKHLISVELNGHVTLSDSIFKGCSSLVNINGIDSVTSFGNYSLSGVPLTEFVMRSNVVYGDGLFSNCLRLNRIDLGGIATLPKYFLFGCNELVTLTGIESLINLSEYSLSGCVKIGDYSFIKGITSFGEYSMSNTGLTQLVLTPSVVYAGGVFSNNHLLESVDFSGIKETTDFMFSNCSKLHILTNTDSLVSIGVHSFSLCESLESFTFPHTLVTLGDYSFKQSGIQSVSLVANATYGVGVFQECLMLNSVDINNSTTISDFMFSGCVSLNRVENTPMLLYIGDSAFSNCTALTSIDLLDNTIDVHDYAFSNTGFNEAKLFPHHNYGDGVYSNCHSLKTVDINLAERIPKLMFFNCSTLANVTHTESIYYISEFAFVGCPLLVRIHLLNVTSIGKKVFSDEMKTIYYHGVSIPICVSDSLPLQTNVFVTKEYVSDYLCNAYTFHLECNKTQLIEENTFRCLPCPTNMSSLDGVNDECIFDMTTCLQYNKNCLLCLSNYCDLCDDTTYFNEYTCWKYNCGKTGTFYQGDCVQKCTNGSVNVGIECKPPCTDGYERIGGECFPVCTNTEERVGNACVARCPREEVRINGICSPRCPQDKQRAGDVCIDYCDNEYEVIDGFCWPKCKGDKTVRYNGVCVTECLKDEERVNGLCMKACKKNEVRIGFVCKQVCKYTEERINGTCTLKCKENEERVDMTCYPKCDANHTLVNHLCVLTCQEDETLIFGQCYPKCTIYEYRVNTRCVANCTEDRFFNGNFCELYCKGNTVFSNGECLKNPCKRNQFYYNVGCKECNKSYQQPCIDSECYQCTAQKSSAVMICVLFTLLLLTAF